MIVRRRMFGVFSIDIPQMAVSHLRQFLTQPRRDHLSRPYELNGPYPINETNGQFERTSPIHPQAKRTLLDPTLKLIGNRFGIGSIAADRVSPGENNQVR